MQKARNARVRKAHEEEVAKLAEERAWEQVWEKPGGKI